MQCLIGDHDQGRHYPLCFCVILLELEGKSNSVGHGDRPLPTKLADVLPVTLEEVIVSRDTSLKELKLRIQEIPVIREVRLGPR